MPPPSYQYGKSTGSKLKVSLPSGCIPPLTPWQSNPIMRMLGLGGGFDFSETAYRDVFLQGKCDEKCLELAKLLGWEVSIQSLGRKRI